LKETGALSGEWEETLKVWEMLNGEREHIPIDLKKIIVHLSLLYKDKG
jgi:hypothetical protein